MNELTFSQRFVARILMACLLFFIVISFLLQHLTNWFYGRSSGLEWPRALNLGYPLILEISVKCETKCYILYDIDVEEFHHALLIDAAGLIRFFRVHSRRGLDLKIGMNTVKIEPFDHQLRAVQPNLKRTMYPVVVGFVSEYSEHSREQIVLCCYVIHVRLHSQEPVDTGVMYTFWKTNWSRLLAPQAIYASRDNSTGLIPHENSDSANLLQNWTPSCFICLSEIKDDLRVLLPCRHAGICLECFKEFRERTAIRSHNPLSGLICPLCRTTITAILRMDSHQDSESANTGNIQLQ
ncbi:hypothetical protein FBUS_07979 [Fasciolopsis buskii]|uniref:RING-type domain-containing protein n=1 Tax=Fasciolopsis buskii TaxID=27845 RepID=A0A8E0RMT2_9TREM|nr:hypothetical protein FBUS_07979 [Fasciolopsis buski]